MPRNIKYLGKTIKKSKLRFIALYTFLGLSALAIPAFLIQRSTYFAPSAREINNLPQQKLEAAAYIKYINQYGLPKTDIGDYKLGETNIKVFAKAATNDKAYLPKLRLYINGVQKPYLNNYGDNSVIHGNPSDWKSVPASNNFSIIVWNIPYLIKEGDEVAIEYFNDTESNREKTLFIDNIEINGRKFNLTSTDNRVWYDRSNRNDGTKYGDQNDFGTSFDNKEVLRYGDYLNFKSGGFNGDMYWNGAIHVQYRKDQSTYPQYKAEYLRDKNKNRFFDDPGLMTRNEKGSCVLTNGTVKCSELNFDWKYSSPDDRYDRIPGDFFLARYTANKFFYPGKYKFSFLVDDGIRFYLDNKLLIDKYNVESGPRLSEVTVDLTKGNQDLKIEYLENTEQASLKFDITRISLDESGLTPIEILQAKLEPYESLDELGDDDKDGLLNIFEIMNLHLATDPLKYDTDANSVSDAYEDTDSDGLLNVLEQKYHTDPLSKDSDNDGIDDVDEIYKYKSDPNNRDSDNDGLRDGLEVELGFSPTNKDSNNNGISDFDEKPSFKTKDDDTGVSLEIKGQGVLKDEVSVVKVDETKTFGGVQAYSMVDISNPQNRNFDSVKISIPYDDSIIQKTKRKNADDLQLVYFNEEKGTIDPLPNQIVDKNTKTITAEPSHFSIYGLIDQETFKEIFSQEFIPNIRGTNGRLNVAFVIDDSTSMKDNDPTGDRIKAPVELIDGLKAVDKGAVITFADGPIVVSELTSNKTTLKAKLNPTILSYYGETFMARAIRRGVEVLRADSNEKTSRIMIVLTDGILDDKKDLEDQVDLAKEHNIIIYTIGLGGGVDDNLLKDVAKETGGKYYKLSKSNELVLAYSDIRNKGKDSDSDGLTDEVEVNGIRTCYGQIIKTDPFNKDMNHDTVLDGASLQRLVLSYYGQCYAINTDPTTFDTDGDGLSDLEEKNGYDVYVMAGDKNRSKKVMMGYRATSNPLKADSDGDGLIDRLDTHPTRWDWYGEAERGDIIIGGKDITLKSFGQSINNFCKSNDTQLTGYPFIDCLPFLIALLDWSHVGIYEGNEIIVDSHPNNLNGEVDKNPPIYDAYNEMTKAGGGVGWSHINEFLDKSKYDKLAFLRVKPKNSKNYNIDSVIDKANSYYGTDYGLLPFSISFANKSVTSNIYCSRLVHTAWLKQDIDLGFPHIGLFKPMFTFPRDIYNDEQQVSTRLFHYN